MGSVTIIRYRSVASNIVNVGLVLPTLSLEDCANVGASSSSTQTLSGVGQRLTFEVKTTTLRSRLTDITLTLLPLSKSSVCAPHDCCKYQPDTFEAFKLTCRLHAHNQSSRGPSTLDLEQLLTCLQAICDPRRLDP